MKQEELRRRLIDGTIHVIAKDGIDKATTKSIGSETGVNEGYIYRYFTDKEDLFVQMFRTLDEELASKTMQHVSVMYMVDMDFETRCRFYFMAVWQFLLSGRDKCLAFIRYFYSPYFAKYSAEEHERRYAPLVSKFKGAFRDEANVWMILSHILSTMLIFAVRVFEGAVGNNEDTAEHVFRLIYFSVRQYFRGEECSK